MGYFGVPLDGTLRRRCLREKQMRKNDLLFRGMMEFPIIVFSRAAQIRAGIWKRNGPGMNDQVLNYSEPPFCRNLQDADIFLVQFALVCMATLTEDETGSGTARLVNLLVHRFGVFDFLGLKMARKKISIVTLERSAVGCIRQKSSRSAKTRKTFLCPIPMQCRGLIRQLETVLMRCSSWVSCYTYSSP